MAFDAVGENAQVAVVRIPSGVGLAAELIPALDLVAEIGCGRGEIVDVGEAVRRGSAGYRAIDGFLGGAALVAVQTEVGGVAQILHCTRGELDGSRNAGGGGGGVGGGAEESVGDGHVLVDRAVLGKIGEPFGAV